jgi:hypothetical protein
MNPKLLKIVNWAANLDKTLVNESLEFHIFYQLFAHLIVEELETA